MFRSVSKQKPKLPPLLPGDQPHPQHRNFARLSIPDALTRHRSGFLYAMSVPQGSQTLQENWQKFGATVLPGELLMPSDGLSVSCFRHRRLICFLFIFPAPRAPGESYAGFIVAGPTEDWSPEAREKVAVRYFLLERSATATPEMFEWRPSATAGDEIFDSLGSGPPPQDPRDFVGVILKRFCN